MNDPLQKRVKATTEQEFNRPFQLIQQLAQPAANYLAHKRSPLYEPSEVSIFHDTRHLMSLHSKSQGFNPPPGQPVMKIKIPGWELREDRFFLSYDGRLMVQWYGDHATYVLPRTYDTVRAFFDPDQLQEAADELMGIVSGAV